MTPAVNAFIAELGADPHSADLADVLDEQLRVLADSDEGRAIEMADSLDWIFRQPRTLREKLVAIGKLLQAEQELPAGTQVSMKALTGWT